MNNEQFRRLMLAKSSKSSSTKDGSPSAPSNGNSGTPLGARQRASIPMTPRSIGGSQADFARQLAERNQASRPQKKFRSSAPRGSKLASGYVDRTKDGGEVEIDDRETRLQALEELLKKEDIDQETFDKLRNQIVGGDLESTHLVKGLDFKLLERIRRGDDVYGEKQEEARGEDEPEVDAEAELDQLGEQEVEAKAKDKVEKKKKGQLSTVTLAPGKKRTRDQILAEWKASREAAKAQREPALGDHFRKIGAKQMPGSRIERDSKGREVLIIVDEDGHEKRKVRKVQPGTETEQNDLLMPDKASKPLGIEVPASHRKQEEPEEDVEVDIFDDVGDNYDPLAGMAATSSDSDSEDDDRKEGDHAAASKNTEEGEIADGNTSGQAMPPPPKPSATSARRNYFQDSKTSLISSQNNRVPSMSDEAVMAAIKKASAIKRAQDDEDDEDEDDDDDRKEAKALKERRKRLLEARDRDEDDIDMGFGTSRFEDEEDLDDSKVKLSVWGDGDDGEGGQKGGSKRKRGPKKRKGDANNAADVLRVMEQRKKS